MRYRPLHGIYYCSKQNIHSSCILWKDCNTVNITVCLTATLIGIRVVVGGWKSLVFTRSRYENRDTIGVRLVEVACYGARSIVFKPPLL